MFLRCVDFWVYLNVMSGINKCWCLLLIDRLEVCVLGEYMEGSLIIELNGLFLGRV